MRSLRLQVDQIDRKILQLLQKRTKLAARIGETKRRHRSVIYVPEREHELLARVDALSRGKLPPGSAVAIYREILSGSRATQRQGAVGLIESDADLLTAPARWCFGACDAFSPQKDWSALARGLKKRQLAAALLSGVDLAKALESAAARSGFLKSFTIGGDFSSLVGWRVPPAQRVFIILPQATPPSQMADRAVVLMKCKSMKTAVKSWFHAMSLHSLCASWRASSLSPLRAGAGESLFYVTLSAPASAVEVTCLLTETAVKSGLSVSVAGTYLSGEGYGG